MANIKQSEIPFIVESGSLQFNGSISRKSNGDFSKFSEGGSREGQNPDFFVNAVEIDWNGAQIGEC